MKKNSFFDIIVIGAGLSGLVLSLELIKKTKKRILLLEKKKKFAYDKNWCFWNFPKNIFSDCYNNKWNKINVVIDGKKKTFQNPDINYLRLKSIDFYKKICTKLKKNNNCKLLMNQTIRELSYKNGHNIVRSNDNIYKSNIVFDSRPSTKNLDGELIQHFYGIELEFEKNVFDDTEMTIMDFQNFNNEVHFFYILPFSKKRGLVESTFFSTKVHTKNKYLQDIKKYIKRNYGNTRYKIIFSENGVIPMFYQEEKNLKSKNIIKIGTPGNWIKVSTGYSFQNSFINAKKMVEDIEIGRFPEVKNKFLIKHLDLIFCEFIKMYPKDSKLFFSNFFVKNELKVIVNFLQGNPKITELIKIILSLPKMKLLKCLFMHLKQRFLTL